MTIDAHTHFYPDFVAKNPARWAERAKEAYWGRLTAPRADGKMSLQGFPSEEKFVADMDEAEVDAAIIQGWYWQNSAACAEMNCAIAEFCARMRGRIFVFASVNPSDISAAVGIVRRARKDGFCGIGEIHDGVQKFGFLSEEFGRLANACADEDLPICVHLTEQNGRDYPGKVETDNLAAFRAAMKFPRTKFIFAHWGGGEIFAGKIPGEYLVLPNVIFDSAATPLQFRGETFPWREGPLKFPRSCAFGSDYPIRLYPRKFKKEQMKAIVEEAKSNVPLSIADAFFGKNILSFAGLENPAAARHRLPENPAQG